MLDLEGLHTGELLAVGRRSLGLLARRLRAIAGASDRADLALQRLLRGLAIEKEIESADIERQENEIPEDSTLATRSDEAERFIAGQLPSLRRPFGEGPLHRDVALFLAESLEEEQGRLLRVLGTHARETRAARLFLSLSDRERRTVRQLREVILQD